MAAGRAGAELPVHRMVDVLDHAGGEAMGLVVGALCLLEAVGWLDRLEDVDAVEGSLRGSPAGIPGAVAVIRAIRGLVDLGVVLGLDEAVCQEEGIGQSVEAGDLG